MLYKERRARGAMGSASLLPVKATVRAFKVTAVRIRLPVRKGTVCSKNQNQIQKAGTYTHRALRCDWRALR